MSMMDTLPLVKHLADLLACPRCDASLTTTEDGHRCDACKVDFPDLDGIPFLFAEPGYALSEWRTRTDMAIQKLMHDAATLESELSEPALRKLTRQRLELLRDACRDQAVRLDTLMKPLQSGHTKASYPTYLALRTRLPSDQGLNTYYNNIHRDWAWGDEENRASCELVSGMLKPNPGKVLVMGAGAGRMAYDLRQQTSAELIVAMDFNPLLLLIAKQLFNGLPISLYEFPLAPKGLADHAVLRKLTAEPVADGLHLLLADALRPPFINGAFDTVVTPWLIDILPTDFMRLATSINHLLSKQGQWINFGSLAFQHQAGTIRYSLEETLSIITECGFDKPVWREDTIPYMDSPASRHARRESVVTFAAEKNTDAKRQQRHTALPDWVVTGKEPVPLLESFQVQAASTRIYSFIMGMIDGKCSIKDMAAQMEQQHLMNSQDAEAAIRSFLIKMLDDAQ